MSIRHQESVGSTTYAYWSSIPIDIKTQQSTYNKQKQWLTMYDAKMGFLQP